MIINCIRVDVFRDRQLGDCSNNGITSRFDNVLLPCGEGWITFDSEKEVPLNFCMIEYREILGGYYRDIVPATVNQYGGFERRPGWWMMGGTFAFTSDARFSQMAGLYPLAIHDRRER